MIVEQCCKRRICVSSYKGVVENSSNKGNMYKSIRKGIFAAKEDYFEDITDDNLMKFKEECNDCFGI